MSQSKNSQNVLMAPQSSNVGPLKRVPSLRLGARPPCYDTHTYSYHDCITFYIYFEGDARVERSPNVPLFPL